MGAQPENERFSMMLCDGAARPDSFASEVRAGLTASPKRLSCRFFYDAEGSRLFEKITELPEYYLTRAELAILDQHVAAVVSRFPSGATLIELGSGNSAKTRLLIAQFLGRVGRLRYVPVDISRTMLEESARALLDDFPGLEIQAVAGEYQEAMPQLREDFDRPKLILWLGSNIGNLDRPDAVEFLRRLRDRMASEDRLLVGIDLRKDRRVLEAAYDDAQGVTAQFNRNLLERINRELGGAFAVRLFRHRARYDEDAGRIEMYLVSEVPQTVRIAALGLAVPFEAGEAIHTENSYKYSLAEIDETAEAAGLRVEGQWLDRDGRFSLNLLVLPV